MSALAAHLIKRGVKVSGSDKTVNEETERLKKAGAVVFEGHSPDNVGEAQLVVRTNAVRENNCEIVEAKLRGIPVVLREQLLGCVFDGFPLKIAVAGVHGKTTVTAMLDTVFTACRADHASFMGGVNNGSNYTDGREAVIAEACEYKESFLCLHPDIAVVLNVEHDHPDYYSDRFEVERAFGRFMDNCGGTVVVGADDVPLSLYERRKNVVTYGTDGFLSAANLKSVGGRYGFDLFKDGNYVMRVNLSVPGRHNVSNALACLCAAHCAGLPLMECAHALSRFTGALRRWTVMPCGFTNVTEDYAHHPTEIRAAVETALSMGYDNVYAVFQPHTYTRTKAFYDGFIDCFKGVTAVGYLPVYAAREKPVDGITSENLCMSAREKGINALYFCNFYVARDYILKTAKKNDLVLILGAGDVYKLCGMLD